MTTKDQERKALEQIRKIVAGLGENSYIGTAFEGCFEIAEQNIDNDFVCSIKQQYDSEFAYRCKIEDELKAVKQELRKANENAQVWQKSYDRMQEKANDYANKAKENWNNFREQEDRVAELEDEIIKLKAKLYDMMVATA